MGTHEVKQPLRLVRGKFMRGDVEEAPEIGNHEQIELLRRYEREVARQIQVGMNVASRTKEE